MTAQPSNFVTLDWLMPLFNEQLTRLYTSWQILEQDSQDDTRPDFAAMVSDYHQLHGALQIADIPVLAQLAESLSQISQQLLSDKLSPPDIGHSAAFANEMLQAELNQYALTGDIRYQLVIKCTQELERLLPAGPNKLSDSTALKDKSSGQHLLTEQLNIADTSTQTSLVSPQLSQLLIGWRQSVSQLLMANQNSVSSLKPLERASYYLWQVSTDQELQSLWYLTKVWLDNLSANEQPVPAQYAALLSQLEQIIDALAQTSLEIDITLVDSEMLNDKLAVITIDSVLADICIRLSLLKHQDTTAKDLLSKIQPMTKADKGFLSWVLSELEALSLNLQDPAAACATLSQIKRQLGQRGWSLYDAHIDRIGNDLKPSLRSEDTDNQVLEQVEKQLQELYALILNLHETIADSIGPATNIKVDYDVKYQSKPEKVRHLRVTVEAIKTDFNSYLQQHNLALLPTENMFNEIKQIFSGIGLQKVSKVVDSLAMLFERLRAANLKELSWALVNNIAESLASLELFLDRLAQELVDQTMLSEVQAHLITANELLDSYITDASTIGITEDAIYSEATPVDDGITRYDDSSQTEEDNSDKVLLDNAQSSQKLGHIGEHQQTLDSDQNKTTSDASLSPPIDSNGEQMDEESRAQVVEESAALKAARAVLKDDNFDMDEEIRDIFIEEAEEVLEQLDANLPIWQQDPQDFAPLAEIRRSFHTLKGSGRMVGAFNAGEMAWAIEDMLNRVLDKTLPVTDELVNFITATKDLIPRLVEDFAKQQPPSIDPAITVLKAKNLLAGQPIDQGLILKAKAAITTNAASIDEGNTEIMPASLSSDAREPTLDTPDGVQPAQPINTVSELPEVLVPFMMEATSIPKDADDADPDIKDIFIEEANEVLATITPLFSSYQADLEDEELLTEVRRGFHTLKGSGRMVGAYYSAELAWSIENMLNRVLEHSIAPRAQMMQLVADVLIAYPKLISIFESNSQDYPAQLPLWYACANAYSKDLGARFDYLVLKEQWPKEQHEEAAFKVASAENPAQDEASIVAKSEELAATDDNTRLIHALNQKMIETSVTSVPRNEEEQEFFEIFIEEARELLGTISAFVQAHQTDSEIEVDDEIIRAFHTLRGGASAQSLVTISEISCAIERNLAQLQQQDGLMSAQHLKALADSVELIESHLEAYAQGGEPQLTNDTHGQRCLESIQALLEDPTSRQAADNSLSVAKLMCGAIDDLLDAEWELESCLSEHDPAKVITYAQTLAEQIKKLMEVTDTSKKFQVLLNALLAVYERLISEPELGKQNETVNALIAGHTQLTGLFDALAGSMSLKIDDKVIEALNNIATPDAAMVSNPIADSVSSNDNSTTSINKSVPLTNKSASSNNNDKKTKKSSLVKVEEEHQSEATLSSEAPQEPESLQSIPVDNSVSSPSTFVSSNNTAAPTDIKIEPIETDEELLEIFLEEAQELDADINEAFAIWRQTPSDIEALKELQRHLHTIKGGARMAGIQSIGDLTHEAETVYEYFVAKKLTPSTGWINVMQGVQDTLSAQIDHVVKNQQSFYTDSLVETLQRYIAQGEIPDHAKVNVPIIPTIEPEDSEENIEAETENVEYKHDYERLRDESWKNDKPDPDILAVFLEEAEDLSVSSHQHHQSFRSNSSDIKSLRTLQRELHTIKGGARMVSTNGIADLAYRMEMVYETLAERSRPATKLVTQLLTDCHAWLDDALFILSHSINPPTPIGLIAALKQFNDSPDSLQSVTPDSLQPYLDIIDDYEAEQLANRSHDISQMPPMSGGFGASESGAEVSNEMIRVPAGLIERMINLSGESAINRARIDMGMSSLTNSIEEMGITVQRLSDQLRRMDIELEAQILSQIDEKEMIDNAGFDPLEMDQYSALNQLSKSLSESTSDLLDIKSTLLEKTRDSESLLLQLSRTQTELQEGLMNSRMVPFSTLTPRLQRIVRQTATEVDKSVELEIVNSEDEIDRNILERLTSPLEHMLRNAVDHGVESSEQRLAAGKPANGHIRLEVTRESSEVVIRLSDDGRGIDVEAVRQKAISQGLIDPNDDSLTDIDVMQYIFNAGLTTTKKVTQISGRGVGLDVVLSEVRQLGGVISVTSVCGEGSQFTLRVPLTVAVSDALVVRAADCYYAIPLVQIERVVRISPDELYDYYQSDKSTFKIGRLDYRIHYLNEILTGHSLNELVVRTNTSLPVIIIKSQTGQSLAMQVDEISGSRIEVVVKPLGKQLADVPGISAATIMGDGSVMLILDLIALMRQVSEKLVVSEQGYDKPEPIQAPEDIRPTILVVDDSVTVRKVTSRFLERQGFRSVVAKDGVDAIEILQELTPDLMLLDIEMPRMDGFEVATQMRHHSRLKPIPIIMITSRTGEKHRERALEIGVDDYMGKPFQEDELLSRIQALLGEQIGSQNDQ